MLKHCLTSASVFSLPTGIGNYIVYCDASRVGIGGVLSQEGHLVAFFSEKLNEARLRYSTYDKKLYAVV